MFMVYVYINICLCLEDWTNMISNISVAINNSIECSAHFGRDPKQLVK